MGEFSAMPQSAAADNTSPHERQNAGLRGDPNRRLPGTPSHTPSTATAAVAGEPRPTPHQPQQRRLLGTPSRDGDDTARIVSIAVPADSLQVPCLFGLAPVFMRVLCGGKHSLLFSLINSLLIHC